MESAMGEIEMNSNSNLILMWVQLRK